MAKGFIRTTHGQTSAPPTAAPAPVPAAAPAVQAPRAQDVPMLTSFLQTVRDAAQPVPAAQAPPPDPAGARASPYKDVRLTQGSAAAPTEQHPAASSSNTPTWGTGWSSGWGNSWDNTWSSRGASGWAAGSSGDYWHPPTWGKGWNSQPWRSSQ